MKSTRKLELSVGCFMLLGILAFLMLALKVSGLTSLSSSKTFNVSADFTNIGGLKVRSPVTIAGVRIGEVSDIQLQSGTFGAKVTLSINSDQNKIPFYDTSARILTEGLLGSNYISITPGFETEDEEAGSPPKFLQNGSKIEKTQEAIVLENLIGQLLFNMNK